MRQLFLGLILAMVAATGLAAEKVYQKGKYLDVDSQAFQKLVGDGSVTRHENNLSVQVDTLVYVGQCEEKKHFSSCRPGNWIIGDPIDVRIDRDFMYLRKPEGGEVKTRIVKRIRANSAVDK